MQTHTISAAKWKSTLDALSRIYEGGLLTALNIESTDDPRAIEHFRSPVASKLLPSAVE